MHDTRTASQRLEIALPAATIDITEATDAHPFACRLEVAMRCGCRAIGISGAELAWRIHRGAVREILWMLAAVLLARTSARDEQDEEQRASHSNRIRISYWPVRLPLAIVIVIMSVVAAHAETDLAVLGPAAPDGTRPAVLKDVK